MWGGSGPFFDLVVLVEFVEPATRVLAAARERGRQMDRMRMGWWVKLFPFQGELAAFKSGTLPIHPLLAASNIDAASG